MELQANTSVSTVKPKKLKPQMSHKRLSSKHIHAALLQAEGRLGVQQLCDKVGISAYQYAIMRTKEFYNAEVERQVSIFRNRVDGSMLGQKAKRNEFREKLVKKIVHVVNKRAAKALVEKDLEEEGGKSGLVLRQRVYQKGGVDTRYVIDHGTVDRLQSLMNDIAKENGEMGAGAKEATGVTVNISFDNDDQDWL